MRLPRFAIVLPLLMTLSASLEPARSPTVSAQSVVAEQAIVAAGEPAPFDGILVTREFLDDLIAAGELGEGADVAIRGWRAAISLAESRAARIEELEDAADRGKWVNRVLGAGCGVVGFLYGKELGRNQAFMLQE